MRSILPLIAQALLLCAGLVAAQTYTVTNNCPSAIDLFIGQDSQGSLGKGQSIVRAGLGTSAGFFYTITHSAGRPVSALARAGFYFEVRITQCGSGHRGSRAHRITFDVAQLLVLLPR